MPSNTPEETAEIERNRHIATILFKHDLSIGSLWWVTEDMWKILLDNYDQFSTRENHPGLSISRTQRGCFLDRIPLLYGTSLRKSGTVAVAGLSKKKGADHQCYFGKFMPARFQLGFIPAFIKPNAFKKRINYTEMKDLETWLKERDI